MMQARDGEAGWRGRSLAAAPPMPIDGFVALLDGAAP
jgi:hypothetical protein